MSEIEAKGSSKEAPTPPDMARWKSALPGDGGGRKEDGETEAAVVAEVTPTSLLASIAARIRGEGTFDDDDDDEDDGDDNVDTRSGEVLALVGLL